MNTLAYLAKEDPLGYFAEPVDASLVPGYKDVVSDSLRAKRRFNCVVEGCNIRPAELPFKALGTKLHLRYARAKVQGCSK